MLFGGSRALSWNVSMQGISDGKVTHIVLVECRDKHKVDLICLRRIERRSCGRFEWMRGWICEKVLVPFYITLS